MVSTSHFHTAHGIIHLLQEKFGESKIYRNAHFFLSGYVKLLT